MKKALAVLGVFVLLAGLGAGAWIVRQLSLEEMKKEQQGDKQIGRQAATVLVNGERALLLEKAHASFVRCEKALEARASGEETAPGEVVVAPGGSHELRAPFAGVLGAGARPLSLGLAVERGEVLVSLASPVTPDARFDLERRKDAALADREKARVELETSERQWRRDDELFKEGNVSQRTVDESQTRCACARQSLAEAESRAASLARLAARPSFEATDLLGPVAGAIVRLETTVGARVQAGDLLLVIEERGSARARVDIPPLARSRAAPPERATIVFPALGVERAARLAGIEPHVRPGTLAVSALYALEGEGPSPRPGEPIVARLAAGSPCACARVPASALLVRDGETWAYVRVRPSAFARRKVTVLAREPGAALVSSGVRPGEDVVSDGAATLLAEELKSLIVVESEGGASDDEEKGKESKEAKESKETKESSPKTKPEEKKPEKETGKKKAKDDDDD